MHRSQSNQKQEQEVILFLYTKGIYITMCVSDCSIKYLHKYYKLKKVKHRIHGANSYIKDDKGNNLKGV